MYTAVKVLHSYWAYLLLLVVFLATFNAIRGYLGGRSFGNKDFSLALLSLITTHLQLVFGAVLYFVSPLGLQSIKANGMSTVMKNSVLRLNAVEHPTVMILVVVLITIGYSKHKKQLVSKPKFKKLTIFYTLAFVLLLSRIPWGQWFN